MEAVLAELALLKAQCGVDYSLTLVSPARHVEVVTSGEGDQGWLCCVFVHLVVHPRASWCCHRAGWS